MEGSNLKTVVADLSHKHDRSPSATTLDAIVAELGESLVSEGLISHTGESNAAREWAEKAFRIAHIFGHDPFCGQEEIKRRLSIETPALIKLNKAIRESDVFQALIVDHSISSQYWKNTILPATTSGSLNAVLENEYRFPFRVGIFPGLSCMFYCTFCGRNHDAKYRRSALDEGNEGFFRLISDAPVNDSNRFYIAGGLEPLTNPAIGNIISRARQRNFRVSMYTNGFMLTPSLIQRQPGLMDLAALRISFFGVNDKSHFEVTGKKGAHKQVVANAKEFLKARNAAGTDTKIGFNFVILPGHARDVLELADVLADINLASDGRGVDFVTLREDFSVLPEEGLSESERLEMTEIFQQLDDRVKHDDLAGLHLDYGYALQAIRKGVPNANLAMVGDADLRRKGYPQLSVVVDLYGDVFLYREAGFLDRPGADRYSIGRISANRGIEEVVKEFLESGREIETMPNDWNYLDAFDHVMVSLLNQAETDRRMGIPFELGPIRARTGVAPSADDNGAQSIAFYSQTSRGQTGDTNERKIQGLNA